MILRITYSDGFISDHDAESETCIGTGRGPVLMVELVEGTVTHPPWADYYHEREKRKE